MKLNRKYIILIVMLVFILMLTAACSQKNDNDQSGQDQPVLDGKVSGDETTAKYESDDGETTFEASLTEEVSLPEDYPADNVPIYPNGKVNMAGKQVNGFVVSIKTDDSIEEVYKYYIDNIKIDSVQMSQVTAEVGMIMGLLGDFSVSVTVNPNNFDDDGKNLIAIAIGN